MRNHFVHGKIGIYSWVPGKRVSQWNLNCIRITFAAILRQDSREGRGGRWEIRICSILGQVIVDEWW